MPFRKKITQLLRRVLRNPRESSHKPPSFEKGAGVKGTPEPHVSKEETSVPISSKSNTGFELVLYGRPSCPYCARVDRVIEELDIEEKITRRLTTYGSEWRTDLRNRTGSTQVPCLFIDGEPMFESLDIIDWMRTSLA